MTTYAVSGVLLCVLGAGGKIVTKIIIDFADFNNSINCGQFAKQIYHNCSISCVCVWVLESQHKSLLFSNVCLGVSSTP